MIPSPSSGGFLGALSALLNPTTSSHGAYVYNPNLFPGQPRTRDLGASSPQQSSPFGTPPQLIQNVAMAERANGALPLSALEALHGTIDPGPSPASVVHQAFSAPAATTSFNPVSLQDIVSALAGPPPSQVSAINPGPPPTLADYWDAAPYQQAANQVRSGQRSGINSVDQAYQQALNSAIAEGKQASAQAAQYVGNAKTDAANASRYEQGNINAALQGAAPGSLLANQLQGTMATLNANNQRGTENAKFLQELVGSNNAGAQQDIASEKQNALQFLNSAVQGELSKIGLTQASDKTRAQQMYQQALRAYQTNNQSAMDAAAQTNARDYANYQQSTKSALGQIMSLEGSLATSPHNQLSQILNGPNAPDQQTMDAFNGAIYGQPGSQPGSPLYGAAHNAPEALARLSPSAPAALRSMVAQWFNSTKQPPSSQQLEQYMSQMLGLGGAVGR